jgi:hypothetical protein
MPYALSSTPHVLYLAPCASCMLVSYDFPRHLLIIPSANFFVLFSQIVGHLCTPVEGVEELW